MSGVTQGSRLDQLRALRARLDQEIAHEERLEALRPKPTPPPVAPPRRTTRPLVVVDFPPVPDPNMTQRYEPISCDELGVSAHDVKEWALDQGMITAIRRGRVSYAIIHAYAAAHP